MALTEYLWIAVLGGICGFAYGFLIGANDVANAFASSVSSKSITLRQAVMIASVCEFGGAILLGASVTSTVRNKIFDVELYEQEPEVLMFGMFTSLFSASVWLFIATYFGMPVSTTHDIVGCILGFTIAAKGFSSVHWDVVRKIIISWVASPVIAGIIAATFFSCVKYLIMRAEKPFERAYYVFPVVLTIGIGVNAFYIVYKGASSFKLDEKWNIAWVIPACFGVGAFFGLLWILIFGPCAKRSVIARQALRDEATAKVSQKTADVEANSENAEFDTFNSFVHGTPLPQDANPAEEIVVAQAVATEDKPVTTRVRSVYQIVAENTFDQDLKTQSMDESQRAKDIWANEEQFDERAEDLFTYIQVFTACLNSFAHGANDVANTIAPMSAILDIYMNGVVSSKAAVPKWVLAYGGFAIVVGLLLYGYKVMKSLGYKLTMLSPSRGASAELGAALTSVTASFVGIPVSTTQCIVGAVTAVGLVGGRQAVDIIFLLKICLSWVGLFFITAVFSAGVFSFSYYSPAAIYPSYQVPIVIEE